MDAQSPISVHFSHPDNESVVQSIDASDVDSSEHGHAEGKKARTQQQVWKTHEVNLLQRGVSKYGRNWKAILEDIEFAPTLGGRSPGSLKLKWYKMTKEHEEKINSAQAWGHAATTIGGVSGEPMPGSSMYSSSNRGWFESLNSPEQGELSALPSCGVGSEPWSNDELQAVRDGVAQWGLNFDQILNDPVVGRTLIKRSPLAMATVWAQIQDGGLAWPSCAQNEATSEGFYSMGEVNTTNLAGDGTTEAAVASMRSWGRQETDALINGFEAYGTDWKAILVDPRFRPHLLQRTCHSLKSKWARMMKKRKREGDLAASNVGCVMGASGARKSHHVNGSRFIEGYGDNDLFNVNGSAERTSMPECSVPKGLPKPGGTMEDYDRSIDEYTRQIGISPANAVLYNHRGVVYYAKELIHKALEDFSTAIALDQSYADAYCNRGMAFNSKGEFDLAIMDCTTAIDINPCGVSATNAFLTRALTHYNKGMLEQCIFDCDSTLALVPKCVSALVTRGLTVLALAKECHRSDEGTQRNYVLALTDFKEAIQVDPNNQQARVWYDETRILLMQRQNSVIHSGFANASSGMLQQAPQTMNDSSSSSSPPLHTHSFGGPATDMQALDAQQQLQALQGADMFGGGVCNEDEDSASTAAIALSKQSPIIQESIDTKNTLVPVGVEGIIAASAQPMLGNDEETNAIRAFSNATGVVDGPALMREAITGEQLGIIKAASTAAVLCDPPSFMH